MSRFSDGNDWYEDYPNQSQMFWSNIERSFKSKRGKQTLQAFIEALEAMPDKRLAHGVLSDGRDVCAVGALIADQRVRMGEDRGEVVVGLGELYGRCECGHEPSKHTLANPDVLNRKLCASCATERQVWNRCYGYNPAGDADDTAWATARAAKKAGFPEYAAYKIEYVNDEQLSPILSEEERYERMLTWAKKELARMG